MPTRYPQEAVLRDGRRLLVRPFTENDVDSLYEFFLHLPPEVRRFAWDRIDNRVPGRELGPRARLLEGAAAARLGRQGVVADATLHRRAGQPPAPGRPRQVADRPGVPRRRAGHPAGQQLHRHRPARRPAPPDLHAGLRLRGRRRQDLEETWASRGTPSPATGRTPTAISTT